MSPPEPLPGKLGVGSGPVSVSAEMLVIKSDKNGSVMALEDEGK